MPSRLYSRLCGNLILPLGDRLAGSSVMRHLDFFADSQYWAPDRLGEARDRMVRDLLMTAYSQVPFYRELYDGHGVSPADIRGVADLPKLPVVTKDMLRPAFPESCTRKTDFRYRDYTTSGSTGKPFVVRIDSESMSRARALMLLRTIWAGWVPGAPTLQFGMSVERGLVKSAKDIILRTHYVSAWDLSDAVLDQHLDFLQSRKVEFLTGYASALYLLAKRARKVGFNVKLRGAVSWATNLLPEYRQEIKAAFGCRTFDSYGVGEGIQVASECDQGRLHMFSLHSTCEVVGEHDTAVPEGQSGRILLTRLDAGAMPLIRYAVGDVGTRAADRGRCPCGRTLPELGRIDGRLGDVIATPSGKNLTVEFFFGLFQHAPRSTINSFQVIENGPGAIHVLIVPGEGFVWPDWEEIREKLLEMAGSDLRVTVEAVDAIPLDRNGKPKYLVAASKHMPDATGARQARQGPARSC